MKDLNQNSSGVICRPSSEPHAVKGTMKTDIFGFEIYTCKKCSNIQAVIVSFNDGKEGGSRINWSSCCDFASFSDLKKVDHILSHYTYQVQESFLPFGFHCFGLIFPAIIVGREVLSLKQNMGFQKSGHTRFLVRVGLL